MPQPVDSGPSNCQTRLDSLRKAIRLNQVTFPAQVPVFACQNRPDIQWRLVELYFVHGWTCARLGERYNVTDRRIHQLLQGWVSRAKTLGYLQAIPVDNSKELKAALAEPGRAEERRGFDVAAPLESVPLNGINRENQAYFS